MNEMYTSPETSKALAEAGLSQTGDEFREMVWCAQEGLRLKFFGHVCKEYGYDGQSGECGHPSHVRALRLDEVLAELTRPRVVLVSAASQMSAAALESGATYEEIDGPPLAKAYTIDRRGKETCVTAWPNEKLTSVMTCGPTDVEAAALLLLHLLRERKGA